MLFSNAGSSYSQKNLSTSYSCYIQPHIHLVNKKYDTHECTYLKPSSWNNVSSVYSTSKLSSFYAFISLKYWLSNFNHSLVQDCPPLVPGPSSVYGVLSFLFAPDLHHVRRASKLTTTKSYHEINKYARPLSIYYMYDYQIVDIIYLMQLSSTNKGLLKSKV